MNPKNILILVLSGAGNLGDECILGSEVQYFRKRYPKAKITIATYDAFSTKQIYQHVYGKDGSDFRTISFFPNNFRKKPFRNIWYFFQQAGALMRSDLVVVGGGGIFFDNEGIPLNKILWQWKIRLFFARLFAKKICFFGISLEIHTLQWLLFFHPIFRIDDCIMVRDIASKRKLASIGIVAECLFDSVFLEPQIQRSFPFKPKIIGFALRGGFLDREAEENIKHIVNRLADEGFSIIFLSHSISKNQKHNDIAFVQKIFGNTYSITQSLQETYDAYMQVDIVVAIRLHSAILAAKHGIPCMMLPYGSKTREIAKILDILEYTIDTALPFYDDFFQKISILLGKYEKEQEKISLQYQEIHANFLQKTQKIDIL